MVVGWNTKLKGLGMVWKILNLYNLDKYYKYLIQTKIYKIIIKN